MKTILDERSPRHIILSEQMNIQHEKESEEKAKLALLAQGRSKSKRKWIKKHLNRINTFAIDDTNCLLDSVVSMKIDKKMENIHTFHNSPTYCFNNNSDFTNACKLPEIKNKGPNRKKLDTVFDSPKELYDKIEYINKMKSLLEDKLKSPSFNSDSGSLVNSDDDKSRKYGSHSPAPVKVPLIKFQFPAQNRGIRAEALKEKIFKAQNENKNLDEKSSLSKFDER